MFEWRAAPSFLFSTAGGGTIIWLAKQGFFFLYESTSYTHAQSTRTKAKQRSKRRRRKKKKKLSKQFLIIHAKWIENKSGIEMKRIRITADTSRQTQAGHMQHIRVCMYTHIVCHGVLIYTISHSFNHSFIPSYISTIHLISKANMTTYLADHY